MKLKAETLPPSIHQLMRNVGLHSDDLQVSLQTPSITTNLDKLNVIYDNDTETAIDMAPIKAQAAGASTIHPQAGPTQTISFAPSEEPPTVSENKPSSSINDFVHSDHPEEVERENYATCKLNTIEGASISPIGHLNFWQPVNNTGVLHLLARVRYQKEAQSDAKVIEGAARTKRESYRTPVERLPSDEMTASSANYQSLRLKSRHKVWLMSEQSSGCQPGQQTSGLIAEITAQSSPIAIDKDQSTAIHSTSNSSMEFADLDAEMIVGQYNLTGNVNSISGRYLMFQLPDGRAIGCCQIQMVETLPTSELDSIASVSQVQPTREDLLPNKFRESNMTSQ